MLSPSDQGLITPTGYYCSPDHAIEYAQKRSLRAKKAKEVSLIKKQRQTAHRAVKEAKRTDLTWQHKVTQQSFNKMRVLEELVWFKKRGEPPTCISCGNELGKDKWACGHYKSMGHNPSLRYDRKNTYLQHNKRCNQMLSGDIQGTASTRGFTQGILERFGSRDGQVILDYCNANTRAFAWHWKELESMRAAYNQEIRELQKTLFI